MKCCESAHAGEHGPVWKWTHWEWYTVGDGYSDI